MAEMERLLHTYVDVYTKLYNRHPSDVRALDSDWVIVNGARMRLTELDYLTQQLQLEYKQMLSQRRGVVSKLVKWFTG